MSDVGEYLKKIRTEKKLSLKDVKALTDINDSVVSNIECGKTECPSPDNLQKLASAYHVPLVDLYLKAGYITLSDLSYYQLCFNGADSLSEQQHEAIQHLIDVIVNPERCP
ncbi:MAG: helix-turn-helix domain-containing protein [Clostridiales bacterium]|jgi:transcriptional regulator with XRE-family HTH domain|nr:helix-turn-helix domain-containing protein [Clostridiales bacterium]